MKIVFVGYMASGKSAISKEVSRKLGVQLIDLDEYIEKKEAMKIAQIFAEKGEIYFRKIETAYLKEVLAKEESFILSLGGGTPCFSGNMDLILAESTSFYFRASVPTIYHRLINEKAKRPLVAQIADEDLQEFIGKHLFERANFYEQANHAINVNDKSVEAIGAEVIELLG